MEPLYISTFENFDLVKGKVATLTKDQHKEKGITTFP